MLSNRLPVSKELQAKAALHVHRSSNVAFIPYSLNIQERICRSWCGLGMVKFSHKCDMYCTRLPGRIFKWLDRDEVDRGNVRKLYVQCGILGIGLLTTTTTFADECSVIKSKVVEYRNCNGSLCNPALFATGKKGAVYLATGHHPLSFTVHVPTFSPRLAEINQGLPIPGALPKSYYTVATSLRVPVTLIYKEKFTPSTVDSYFLSQSFSLFSL